MNLWLPGGKEWWGEIVGEFSIDMYTLLYLKWITSKILLYSTENSAQCYVVAWVGGGFGGKWIHIYPPETITTLLISYTSIQKKKSFLLFLVRSQLLLWMPRYCILEALQTLYSVTITPAMIAWKQLQIIHKWIDVAVCHWNYIEVVGDQIWCIGHSS